MQPISIALADSIIARYPDPDTIPYRRWCYVQGYVLLGMDRLYDYTGNPAYLNYLLRFADQHVGRDGTLRDFTGVSLDDVMAGTAIVAAWERTGEQRYRLAAGRVRDTFRDYPRNSDGGFWHNRNLPGQMWIDGVFMGMMFLTRYGASIGDADYCFAEATRQILTFASRCRKGDFGLYLHAFDESRRADWADPTTGLSPEVWSEGLGWYALVLVETLHLLPLDHPDRPAVLTILRDLVAGLRATQDPATGLWYQVVDKGDAPRNWHDTSGSAMFVYAIQRAIDLGYVDAAEYGPVVERGYRGVASKVVVNADGLVDVHDACDGVCVQRSYDVYVDYPQKVNAKEAVPGVLWATAIVEKPSRA